MKTKPFSIDENLNVEGGDLKSKSRREDSYIKKTKCLCRICKEDKPTVCDDCLSGEVADACEDLLR